MSTSGETADLMVRESIQITESAVKLAALGAKNLAALLLALANDNQKIAGKTTLRKLLQSGDEIALFSINEKDLKDFQAEGKTYGFLYCPIINKAERTGTVEILAAEDFDYALAAEETPEIRISGSGFVYAPVVCGAEAGFAHICINGKEIGKVPLIYGDTVEIEPPEEENFFRRLFKRN